MSNNMEFNICTYNCCSLIKNIDIVRELTKKDIDIIFLQETFITNEKLGIIDFINENYHSVGIPAYYSDNNIVKVTGRPIGGLVCLWKKDCFFDIKTLYTTNDIFVLDMSFSGIHITLVNVYLRSDHGDIVSQEKYLQTLSELESILLDYNCNNILFCGDFNTDPFISRAWNNLKSFLDRNDLYCFDINTLGSDTFTHINYGTYHCRWLDHIIGRLSSDLKLENVLVLDDLIGSDHLPLLASFSLHNVNNVNINKNKNLYPGSSNNIYIDWNKISKHQLLEISNGAYQVLGNFRNMNYLDCSNELCFNQVCKNKIDEIYINIIESIKESSKTFKKIK